MKKFIAILVFVKEIFLEIIMLPFFELKAIILKAKLKKAKKDIQQHNRELEAEYGTSDPQELSVLLVQHEAELSQLKAKLEKAEQVVEHHDNKLEIANKTYEDRYISHSQYLSSLLAQLSAVEDEKDNLEESHGILAIEFFDQYREGLDMIEDASLKSVYEELSADERSFWEKRCNELQLLSNQKLAILKKISSPEALHSLETANANWNETIAPLIKNKLHAKIKFEGKIPPNILEELRSNEPGNELLREMVKNNPDLLKHCINLQYANNLSGLLTCDTYVQQYLDKMPEDFQVALKNYRETLMF
ncbi:hypothetical protein SC438_15335 [Legionella pneumophila]|uniref:hypothetical protein n=1 Tax=Legionella pneumophila TaxID=446 RepID=UPI001374EC61|nr:hypothetical protein [Legionella pneumophila]HAT8817026.1 hypothetical protein [Legionella pneumophila subsp. pneumophila]MCZ4805096.1 hypothetical protein [Legionella pneumophila]MDW9181079.1 hypothetical protein [Legionella pneumophila]HAT1825493.1 hypothetical protein [Legionella pneumophila]HAT1865980.1 hypothetical protein [Legionella pneumophila]